MKEKPTRSEASIRSFVAIDISGEIRDNLKKIAAELKPKVNDIKWGRVDGIHLTLKFLGNVAQSMIPSLRGVMEEAAHAARPFKIGVKGLGAFPNPRNARVIWAGLEEPTGALEELALRIEKEMEPLGFAPEKRPFHPHLTIGRARKGGRPGKELVELIEHHHTREFGSFTANELILFKSDLKPGGAVYTKMETVGL